MGSIVAGWEDVPNQIEGYWSQGGCTDEYQLSNNSNSIKEDTMQSTITSRGQTVIPAAIRRQFHLSPADRLEWVLDNGSIRVGPVRANPVEAFRGRGAGGATARLLAARPQDRATE
jgi:AbrB family looped-hinge helix DNA binding protein